jgi:AcrR family transcriptional regulator
MADIAEAAGISRATLYGHFKDKEQLFRALADGVVTESLQHMREAWQENTTFDRNLEAAILAKDGRLHRFKHSSPHGGELLASNSEAILACARTLEAGFVEFLCSRASQEEAEGRCFEVFGGVPAFGVFVAQAAAGFKDAIASEELYQRAIHIFAELVETATRIPLGPSTVIL